ncbi:hypothetical protein STEG23_034709, partial [Scotinomys teguina]
MAASSWECARKGGGCSDALTAQNTLSTDRCFHILYRMNATINHHCDSNEETTAYRAKGGLTVLCVLQAPEGPGVPGSASLDDALVYGMPHVHFR